MTNQSVLPEDRKGNFASIMQPTVAQVLNASDNANDNANAEGRSAEFNPNTTALRLLADSGDAYFKLGESTVTASTSDHYLRNNTYMEVSTGDYRYIQFRRVAAANVSIRLSELE